MTQSKLSDISPRLINKQSWKLRHPALQSNQREQHPAGAAITPEGKSLRGEGRSNVSHVTNLDRNPLS